MGREGEEKKSLMEILKSLPENAKELWNRLDRMTKMVFAAIAVFLFLGTPIISGYFKMFSMALKGAYTLHFATSQSVLRYFLIGIAPFYGLGKTLIGYIIEAIIMGVAIAMRAPELNPIAESDDRGVDYAEKGTYGTAHWMSRKEAEAVYTIGNIKDATGYILGQFTENGEECISLPTTASGNQNYLVIGSPGRGKTFSFGFNAVLQSIVRNESVIVVDPKGELCEKLYSLCQQKGYVVKVYNMVKPEVSNAWNFCNEIFDVNTGRMDFSRLTAFCDITMTNTMDGEREDAFWGPGERNLFQAAVAYAGWKFEKSYEFNLNRTADQWENVPLPYLNDAERTRLFETIRNPASNLREKETSLRLIMKASDLLTDDEVDQCIVEIKEASDPISIDKVFGMFVRYDINELETMFDKADIPASHPASIAWSMFKKSDAKIKPNLIQGLTQRLKLFANTDIISMSAHDDINFRSLGDRKTAIFCILSDKDSSRKLLTSLFFSFLFRDVSDAADELGPEHRIPVNVMCDEFANIGRIPDFDRFISTVRSRKIYLSIIIQSIAQLAKVYDINDQETLRECCDTVLFLGCNGEQTASYISELSGVASIITSSVRDMKNIAGMRGLTAGFATSDGAGKRYVINPDEARRLGVEEVLIYHAGQPMLRAKRCGYIHHPFVKEGLPPKTPLSSFPKTVDIYGPYASIFDEYSEIDLARQKTLNIIGARLQEKVGQKDTPRTSRTSLPEVSEEDAQKAIAERDERRQRDEQTSKPTAMPKPPEARTSAPTSGKASGSNTGAVVVKQKERPNPYAVKPSVTPPKSQPIPQSKDKTSDKLTGIANAFNSGH